RWPVHYRGGGDAACESRKAAGYRGDAARQFRADAGQVSRGAARAARARAQGEAEAGLPPPQTGLTSRSQAKWTPVRVKKTRQTEHRSRGSDFDQNRGSAALGCLSLTGRI